jgi:uncharacterized membrane protein required for colicin V production
MIAAGLQSLNNDKLPIGWFDGVVVILIGFGLFRGRKNGMVKELLPLFLWLGIVIGGGLGYEKTGQIFINNLRFNRTTGCIFGYLSIALAVWLVFLFLKRLLDKRMTGSGVFGGSEYYLGMISGMVRYVCVVLFVAALLNAPFYTAAEIKAHREFNNRVFGGGEKGYSGDYIPSVQEIQEQVFKKSLAGPFIKDKLGIILIETAPVGRKTSSAYATHS